MDKEQYFLNINDNKLEKTLIDILKIEQVENIIEFGAGKGNFTLKSRKKASSIIFDLGEVIHRNLKKEAPK